jgi:hypothetical protein
MIPLLVASRAVAGYAPPPVHAGLAFERLAEDVGQISGRLIPPPSALYGLRRYLVEPTPHYSAVAKRAAPQRGTALFGSGSTRRLQSTRVTFSAAGPFWP